MTEAMPFYALLTGLVVSATCCVWLLLMRGKLQRLLLSTQALRESEEQQQQRLQQHIEKQQQTIDELRDQLQHKSQQLGVYGGQLEQQQEFKQRFLTTAQELSECRQQLAKADTQSQQLREEVGKAEARYREQFALLKENKDQLKMEFENLSQRIFDDKHRQLNESNIKGLNGILDPLKSQLEGFRQRIDSVHSEQIQGQAGLRNELDNLRRLNQQITKEASNLTKALKGDKKLQGNFGEQQVELLLQQSGLRRDIEYRREPGFKDDEQQNRRPDFIINLPDGKHIIIDSKVSLNDYSAYVSSDNDVDRQHFLARHVNCIKNHINSLSEKDYPKLQGMQAPDFVFLFMPIEPSFLAAMEAEPALFNNAYDKRIAVVTPTTLLPLLRTVASLWTIDKQNKSSEQLASQAAKVYDRLRIFVEKMEKLGGQLNTAQTTYDDAWRSLYSGRGNLVMQAEKFKALGVRTKKSMPESVTQGLLQDPIISLE